MNGIAAFLEVLAGTGVRYLFGNPGTTELPLIDALARDARFQYVFGLQEIPVVAMADGFAMASGGVGVANVHISCGLGNALGMLYNAFMEGTPLVLTAGQQDRRLQVDDPVLAADLVRIARPWTKWAAEAQRVEDVPTLLRRGLQIAQSPPSGPVFLSLPLDVQLAAAEHLDLRPPHILDRRIRPPREALAAAARMLADARNPIILAGSRVTESDGIAELVAVAERLGAPVLSESTSSHGRLPFPPAHPLYAGRLPLWSPQIHARLQSHDVLFAVGLNVLRLYLHQLPERPLPPDLRLIHLDNAPHEIGKSYAVEIGLLGDPKSGLAELDELLAAQMSLERRQLAAARQADRALERQQERLLLRAECEAQSDQTPLTPLAFMHALGRVLPPDVAVVEEAVTTHQNVFERLGVLQDPRGFFAHRGWALGWGLGCALGVKLAWPQRPVLGLLGDGASLYGIQGLWSAAHHRIPVTFVIANNSQYKILKTCGDLLSLRSLHDPRCPGLDLTHPAIDFVGLARSFGVFAQRVTAADELSDCVRDALAGETPRLIEVPISE